MSQVCKIKGKGTGHCSLVDKVATHEDISWQSWNHCTCTLVLNNYINDGDSRSPVSHFDVVASYRHAKGKG